MTVRPLNEHQDVLVRGRVLEVRATDCFISIESHLDGRPTTVLVPHTEVFQPESSDGLHMAVQAMLAQLDRVHDIAVRIQAEAYELAGAAQLIEQMRVKERA